MEELLKHLEKTAAELVLVEVDDLPALASLHDLLLELRERLSGHFDHLVVTVDKSAALVEKIIRGDVDEPDRQMELLREGMACLQAAITRKNINQISFPEALAPTGLKTTADTPRETYESEPGERSERGTDLTDGPASEDAASDFILNTSNADSSLLAEFITEGREHCSAAEQSMMELEVGSDQDAAINGIFRAFHTIKGAAGFLDLGPIGSMAHESETLLDKIRKGAIQIDSDISDIIFNAIDTLRKLFTCLEGAMASGEPTDARDITESALGDVRAAVRQEKPSEKNTAGSRVGDILVQMGAVDQGQIDATVEGEQSAPKRLGEKLIDRGVVKAKSVAHALRVQQQRRQEADPAKTPAVPEMVRIDTQRLDSLMDTIGELVIAESMVSQDGSLMSGASPRAVRNVSHLSKITRELQEMSMNFRLVPIKPTVQKLARAVRDIAKRSGKQVELVTFGEDTEVDRGIVENIGDPLMHMVRNSVDHALETTEERLAAGKPQGGRLWLRTYQKSGNIFFEVEDDGRGLDSKAILAKARTKGIVGHQQELSEEEIHRLILMPGFSTAQKVTDISGRGVGMDVVKKNLEKMRGHLDISSKWGVGTKFTIRLPLTLAIIDGMLIRIGDQRYIIPTMSVSESVNLTRDMVRTISGRHEMITHRGRLLPLVYASDLFERHQGERRGERLVVVVLEDGGRSVGFVADELLGKHQTVIKGLGPLFAQQKCVSGGAILSDGSVGLIVDTSAVIQTACSARSRNTAYGSLAKLEDNNDRQTEGGIQGAGEGTVLNATGAVGV